MNKKKVLKQPQRPPDVQYVCIPLPYQFKRKDLLFSDLFRPSFLPSFFPALFFRFVFNLYLLVGETALGETLLQSDL